MKFDSSKSLAIKNPELIDEWHPELNGSLTPCDVSYGSHKKAWWVCRTNPSHIWAAEIRARHSGSNCPYCAGKKASIDYCLAAINPALAEEWHPTKNEGLTPYDVVPNSYKMVWWKCKNCGNEWLARIAWRNCGTRCPECTTRKKRSTFFPGEKALSTVNPELAKEWHPVKNNRLTPDKVLCTSSKKVWWICGKCGFEWKAAIGSRSSNDTGCPNCKETKALSPENCLAAIHPELVDQWDQERNGSLTPYDVFPGNFRRVYWQCSKGHKYQMRISDKTKGMGCSVCSRRQNIRFPKQALFYYLNQVFGDTKRKYLYYVGDKNAKLDIFIPSLNLGVEYDGYFAHMRPNSDVYDEQKNAVLKDVIQLIRIREEGLPQINPFGSTVIIRSDTTENTSLLKCLISIGEYIRSHYNLSKEQLELVDSWSDVDIDKDEVVIGSYIGSSKQKQRKFAKSMAELRPELLEEWDYTKNGDLSPYSMPYGTSKKVWWICKTCNNSWEAQVRHRVKRFINGKVIDGTGCPKCGFKKIAESSRKMMLARYASHADSRKQCIE